MTLSSDRRVARWVLSLIVIALGVVAAGRLPVGYLPQQSFPEATVSLRLGEERDIDVLAADALLDLESALRSVGAVQSFRASVTSWGAEYRVRFVPGVDLRAKVARLDAELGRLRRRLPELSRLEVRRGRFGEEDRQLVLWLTDDVSGSEVSALRDRLSRLVETRSVVLAGASVPTLRIEPKARVSSGDLRAQVEGAFETTSLGAFRKGSEVLPVRERALEDRSPLEQLPVTLAGGAVLPLRAVAEMQWVEEAPEWRVRLGGRDGRALFVTPGTGRSLIRLLRAVRKELDDAGLSEQAFVLDENVRAQEELRMMLWRTFGSSWILCTLVGLFSGHRAAWFLVAPVACSSSLNLVLLARVQLDVGTVIGLLVGLCAAPLVLVARQTRARPMAVVAGVTLTTTLLVLAVGLSAGVLAPLLSPAAMALAASAVAASWAALLPPLGGWGGFARVATGGAALLRYCLSRGWTVALLGLALTAVLLILFGGALRPRSSDLSPPRDDLALDLLFAQGTSLQRAGDLVAAVEGQLLEDPRFARVWSRWSERGGVVLASVVPPERARARLQRLARELEGALHAIPVALRVRPLGTGGARGEPLRFRPGLESEPETDETASTYRFLLRGSRVDRLVASEITLRERLAREGIRARELVNQWGPPVDVLELRPRRIESSARVKRAVDVLRSRMLYPRPRRYPGTSDVGLQVRGPEAPPTATELPSRAELERWVSGAGDEEPLRFVMQDVVAPSQVLRENGRFVLPLDLRMRWAPPLRVEKRLGVHRILEQVRLPAGVEVARPSLSRYRWHAERWHMVSVMLALPALLVIAGVIWSNGLFAPALSTLPAVLAAALAAALFSWSPFGADELSLLAFAGSLCVTLPVSWVLSNRLLRAASRFGVRGVYRRCAPHASAALSAAAAAFGPLVLAVAWADAERFVWVPALLVAGATGLVLLGSQWTLVPVLAVALEAGRALRSPESRARAHPEHWAQDGGAPRLTVKKLSKVYPPKGLRRAATEGPDDRARHDGFHALKSVDLDLLPGVIGLLGPNGSGKTTLLRLLCGLLEPSRGRILYRGTAVEPLNLPAYRRGIGFLPQGFNAYEGLTARAFLGYWALERGLSGRSARAEVERVLELVGLEDRADKRVRDLSGGMRRRIGIARSLLGDPAILIIDEPTTGLDLESRQRLRETLLDVAADRIIVFSTHIASDIAAIAHRVVVLHRGRLAFDGSLGEMITQGDGRVVSAVVPDAELAELSRGHRVTTRVRTREGVRVRLVLAPGAPAPAGASRVAPDLEEAYLALMAGLEQGDEGPGDGYGALLDMSLDRR